MDNEDAVAGVVHAALRRMKSASANLDRQKAWYDADPTDENAMQYARAWVELVSAREHLCNVTLRAADEVAVAS